jgi:L-fucose mutarotase
MLKNIDPLLNADVLYALAAMGHGDTVVICDANFPADAIARSTVYGSLLHMEGVNAARAVRAVLSVMPLDSFSDDSARRMEIVDSPNEIPPVQREVQIEIEKAEDNSFPLTSIERMDFYNHARDAYCVIATGERRFYGCFIFRKGVVAP